MRNCFAAFSLAVVVFGEPTSTAAAGPAVHIASTVRADAKSGRLVRKTFAPSLQKLTPAQLRDLVRVDELILEAASRHEVDPLLVRAVIEVESNYNPFAVSPKGAQGLMQLVGPTAERFGVKNSFVPSDNIEAGVRYLKYLQRLFQDDQLALAAYNAGEGAVAKYNRVPPYRETQDYVQKVGTRYRELQDQAGAGAEKATPEATEEPHYRPLEAFVDSEGRLHLRTR
ncbi:MAG: lytic transglycosylase domain-containing protein [Bryobacteraceae bacterium]|nr:lytic transglycosylase domain-containing protein [Bryobacteraceae bacterium]